MFKIFMMQLKNTIFSIRFLLACVIGVVIQIIGIMPLYDFSTVLGKPLCIYEGTIFLSAQYFFVTAVFLGAIVLFSEIPYLNIYEVFALTRIDRKKWIAGKIISMFVSCQIYYLVAIMMGSLIFIRNSFVGNIWSVPFYALGRSNNYLEYNVSFYFPHVFLISPAHAFLLCYFLSSVYAFTMGLVLFLCSIAFNRRVGYVATLMLHVVSYMILILFKSPAYYKWSLLGQSMLVYHEIGGRYSDLFWKPYESVVLFAIIDAILIVTLIYRGKRLEFR